MASKKAKMNIPMGTFSQSGILLENSDYARNLYNQNRFGALLKSGKVKLSLLEGIYLLEKEKIEVKRRSGRKMIFKSYIRECERQDKDIMIKYVVFKDMRERGYIIKTALKFGAEFRIYDRGIKPGEDHAKWVCYPIHESKMLTWHDFAAKNRVAHSTKKRLLIGIVDDEEDVTYYEVKWTRP